MPVVAPAVVVGLLFGGIAGSSTRPVDHRHGAASAETIRSHRFSGTFTPEQVVSAAGGVWVVGATLQGSGSGCAVGSVDPATLQTQVFPAVGSCPYVAVGDGHLYLTAVTYVGGTNSEEIRIESFDTVTHQASVLAPVVMTVIGSAIAHIALTYGEGSLWLYGFVSPDSGVADVLQISPATGAVLRTITGVPAIGGGHPAIAADAGGLWLAAGPGGGGYFDHLAPGATTLEPAAVAPKGGSILWLAAIGHTEWAEVAVYGHQGRTVVTRLVAFDASGTEVLETPPEELGAGPVVGSDRGLWAVGDGASCPTLALESYPLDLWRVDPSSGRSVVSTTLRSPVDPCDIGQGSYVAVTGRSVFVLEPSDTTSQPSALVRVSA
jgi:hypothetical protein